MYKQNISRFQNPTISIPLTNNRIGKRENKDLKIKLKL